MRLLHLVIYFIISLVGMATAFSARRQAAIKQLSDITKNTVATAVVAATLFSSQPSDAILVQNGGLDNNGNTKLFHSQLVVPSSNIQTIHTASSSTSSSSTSTTNAFTSSIELSNSMANPMGEFKPETETGISPAFSTFGQWFFLLYVVVSLLAGGKEILGRIMKQVKDE